MTDRPMIPGFDKIRGSVQTGGFVIGEDERAAFDAQRKADVAINHGEQNSEEIAHLRGFVLWGFAIVAGVLIVLAVGLAAVLILTFG